MNYPKNKAWIPSCSLLALVAACGMSVGCENSDAEDAADDAAEVVEDAAEETGEAIDDAADEVDDAVDDVVDETSGG